MDSKDTGSKIFNYEIENKYLKLTITALRNKMETLQIKQDE